jgi:hypothetical protein
VLVLRMIRSLEGDPSTCMLGNTLGRTPFRSSLSITLRSRPMPIITAVGCTSFATPSFEYSYANRVSSLSKRIRLFIPEPSVTLCDMANVRIVPPSMVLNCILHVANGRSLPMSLGYRHEQVIRKMRRWKLGSLKLLERGHCRSQVSYDELHAPVKHVGWQRDNDAA